jgi:hypothetical protein
MVRYKDEEKHFNKIYSLGLEPLASMIESKCPTNLAKLVPLYNYVCGLSVTIFHLNKMNVCTKQ